MTSAAPTGGARHSDPPDQSHPGRPNPTSPRIRRESGLDCQTPTRPAPLTPATGRERHTQPREHSRRTGRRTDPPRRLHPPLVDRPPHQAADLLDDAETLHQNNSFARARSLAVLAREEALPWCEFKESNLA
ncbi:AbiV family abortive infection protein [Luteimicrobium xylanilyticum]